MDTRLHIRRLRSGGLSKCDLCDHVRRHLVSAAGLQSPELQPTGFYANNPAPTPGGVAEPECSRP